MNRIVRAGMSVLAVSAIALSLGAKGGCGGPPPGEKNNVPGKGEHYKCGYVLNGSGFADVTFDIEADGKDSKSFRVSVPHSAKNAYTCTHGAEMNITASVSDPNHRHSLQCKLYQKGQQSAEDHDGILRAPVNNPRVHCRYP